MIANRVLRRIVEARFRRTVRAMLLAIAVLSSAVVFPVHLAGQADIVERLDVRMSQNWTSATVHLQDIPGLVTSSESRSFLFAPDSSGVPEIRLNIAVPPDAEGFSASLTDYTSDAERAVEAAGTPSGSEFVRIIGHTTIRGVPFVSLALRPFTRFGDRVQYWQDASVQVDWKRVQKVRESRPPGLERPEIAREFSEHIINYEEFRSAFAIGPAKSPRTVSADESGWGIGEPAVIVETPAYGVYRIYGADLQSVGVPGALSVSKLRLSNDDRFHQLVVRDENSDGLLNDDDWIAFEGIRRPGDTGIYLNEITDTNSFVLTWSGGDGKSPVDYSESSSVFSSVVDSYDTTLHFEKEQFWFGGLWRPDLGDEAGLHVSERVPHERFYWRKGTKAVSDPLIFDCSPVYGAGNDVELTVRLAGVTYWAYSLESPDQVLHLRLNGIGIGTVSIRDTADTAVSLIVPSNYLVNGRNRLQLDLVPHDTSLINEVMIDYIEIKGRFHAVTTTGSMVMPTFNDTTQGVRVVGYNGSNIAAISGHRLGFADSVVSGTLVRVTSRGGNVIRQHPGFYAEVGGTQYISPSPFGTGLAILEVDDHGGTPRIVRSGFFPTSSDYDEFDRATQFVDAVQADNIVVAGLAYASGHHEKPADFVDVFEALGSEAVRDEDFFSASWTFVARKGDPSTAHELFAHDRQGSVLNALVPGDGAFGAWSGVIQARGTANRITSSPVRSPQLRYHEADVLTESSNQADLIIITHPEFASEAERLAEHRRGGMGVTADVVGVYQIYDEFNKGQKHPIAIRRFLQFADTNWQDPKPTYVVLFGDASWDSQQRMEGSVMTDYIPSSGVPSTDQKFVAAFGDSTLAPQQFIGRLPISTVAEAREVVDKLIEYDQLEPARWNKHIVFATGGTDVAERDRLRDVALSLGTIFSPRPFLGEFEVISRSGETDDELKFPSTVDGDRVRAAVDPGALILDFNGHGATTTLDLNFGYPEDFNNGNRYFILSTWSCQTGLFSNPYAPLRNELFLTAPDRGTVASIGGTSFSFTNVDNHIRRFLYSRLAENRDQRALGAMFSLAKHEMFSFYGYGTVGDNGYRARNHFTMYNLLGDPSMNVAAHGTPEIAVPEESGVWVGLDGREPALGDSVVGLRAAVWNFGMALTGQPLDSGFVVSARLVSPSGQETEALDTVRGLGRYDSVEFRFPLGEEAGEYSVVVTADPEEVIPESYREDNRAVFTRLLVGSQPLALEPVRFGVVDSYDDITIRLLNPATGPGALFLLDTVPSFDSPALVSSDGVGTVVEQELTTEWTFSIPSSLRGAREFWWKGISTSADPDLADRFPLVETFTVATEPVPPTTITNGTRHFDRTRLTNLVNRASGIGPGTREVPVYVRAYGQTWIDSVTTEQPIVGKPLTVRVGEVDYRKTVPAGTNILVFPANDVVPVIDTAFIFYDGTPLEEMEDLIFNQIQPGQRVILATSGQSWAIPAPDSLQRLKAMLSALGSSVADTLTFLDSEGTYALIGGKNVDKTDVKEMWIPALPLRRQGLKPPFVAELYDTIQAVPRAGTWTSSVYGPSTEFRSATFEFTEESNQPLDVVVYGIGRDGIRDSLGYRIVDRDNPVADLSFVPISEYPRLELSARFTNDTLQRVREVRLDYDPSPELAVVPSTVRVTPDSVMQGEEFTISWTVANLTSFQPADNVVARVAELGELGSVVDSVQLSRVLPLDSNRVSLTLNSDHLRSDRSYAVSVNTEQRPPEPYGHDNQYGPIPMTITTDRLPPGFEIYADGNRVVNGDYVAPSPEFEIRLYDNSTLQLNPASSISLVLDNVWITPEDAGEFEAYTAGELRGAFRFVPEEPLGEGPHDLRVFVKDATGNGDTSEIMTVYVEPDLDLRNVVNWPNPFERETTFLFTVTGQFIPESGEITVFAPSGRKIKSIPLGPGDLAIGQNRVEWNGLDDDLDRLANGVYFYRVRLKRGDQTSERVEKLVVLR